MKIITLLFALMLPLVSFATDEAKPTLKEVMDTPLALVETPASVVLDNKADIWKLEWADDNARRFITVSPRTLFAWAGATRGKSAKDLATVHAIMGANANLLRETMLPALKEAKQINAAGELEEALKLVEKSKTLDRAAQDKFARLALVAPAK